MLNLDAKQAKQHGMPERLPIPKDQFEAAGTKGLTHDAAVGWVTKFLAEAGPSLRQKEPATAKRYEAYIAKMKFWQDAQKAFTRRDFSKAASLLQLVSNVDKEDYAAKHSLATVNAALGNHEAATRVFGEIAEVWSGSAEYHVAFANALLAAGQRDPAIEQFVLALEADAECRPAMEGLVTLGLLVKVYEDPLDPKSLTFIRRDALLEYLTEEWGRTPQSVEFLLRVGAYHESERRYDVALAASEHIVDRDPDNEAGVLLHASALRHLGRVDEARTALANYLKAHPQSPSVLAQLASLELVQGDKALADQCLDQALDIDPGHLTALQLKFFGDLDSPPLERAQEVLPLVEAYAERHSSHANPRRLLGRILLQINNEEPALSALHAAAQLAPGDDDVLAEYLNALLRYGRFQTIIEQVGSLADLSKRDWRLRWSEADAYLGLGRKMEARAAFTAINADENLHVAVRARAKRAVESLGA